MSDIRTMKQHAKCEVEVLRPFGLGDGEIANVGEVVVLAASDALMVIDAQKAKPANGYTVGEGHSEDDDEDFEDDDEE